MNRQQFGPDRIPVLMYHRVGTPLDPSDRRYCIEPALFRAHMQALADAGYRAIPVTELVAWLDGTATVNGPKSFVLTFDDGFTGVHDHALPVLGALAWPATVFLVAGQIGGEDRWTRAAHPQRPPSRLLSQRQIERMQDAGFSFHSHSMNHRALRDISDAELEEEVGQSRARLQDLLGHPVDFFAYPYGQHDDRVVTAVRAAGYRAAFSVLSGFNRRDVDRYRIRRLDVFGTDSPRQLLRKIRLGTNDGGFGPVCRYYAQRLFGLARAWSR